MHYDVSPKYHKIPLPRTNFAAWEHGKYLKSKWVPKKHRMSLHSKTSPQDIAQKFIFWPPLKANVICWKSEELQQTAFSRDFLSCIMHICYVSNTLTVNWLHAFSLNQKSSHGSVFRSFTFCLNVNQSYINFPLRCLITSLLLKCCNNLVENIVFLI